MIVFPVFSTLYHFMTVLMTRNRNDKEDKSFNKNLNEHDKTYNLSPYK